MAQENFDWEEYKAYSKDLSDLKKLIQEEEYISTSIGYYINAENYTQRKWIELYRYDLPRAMHFKYKWVIRWRVAKLQCQYPREDISQIDCCYDKKAGFDPEKKRLLERITNHYTQIKRQERILAAYNKECQGMLFETPKEQALRIKIEGKIANRKAELALLIKQYKEYQRPVR